MNNSKTKLHFKIELETIILGFVIICAIVLLILVIMNLNNKNKDKDKIIIVDDAHVVNYANSQIDYNNPALYHSTKSVDGEHQFNADTQWKSQPSKCFDCEAQLEATCGNACVYNATKQKVF